MFAQVAIHSSQFPDRVRNDLIESLRTRRLNHKFLYDSVTQTQKWLNLHRAYSPSRTDPDCAAVYESASLAAASAVAARPVHLVGLGCGGGQKDTRLLRLLRAPQCEVRYTPVDVSTSMVLAARHTALTAIPEANCAPLVCDLASVADWSGMLDEANRLTRSEPGEVRPADEAGPRAGVRAARLPAQSEIPANAGTPQFTRLLTFFGMIPNFEPEIALPRLAQMVRPGDALLMSANLAPGADYAAGVRKILPLYDNALTRDWLMAALVDLGVESGDGHFQFRVEENSAANGLRRIAAYFCFTRARQLDVDTHRFEFAAGDSLRVFYSYRHTPERAVDLLASRGLAELGRWITPSDEEGVFLFEKR